MKKTILALYIALAACSSVIVGSIVAKESSSPKAGIVYALATFAGAMIVLHAYRNERDMALGCSTITSGNIAGCATIPKGGLEIDYYVINREHIDLTLTTFGTDGEIDNLVLTGVNVAYKFTAKGTANSDQVDMFEGKYTNDNWTHIFNSIIFDNTAATKKNIIKKFPSSDVVVIKNNKWKGTTGNMAFEALGFGVGLTGKAIQRKSDDGETQNAWKVSLASPKDQYEDNPGLNVFDTDYSTTLSMLEALL
jgi:hypothetical protein